MICKAFNDRRQIFTHLAFFYLWLSNSSILGEVLGPSNQPEAYFNGSNYIRLHRTISLKNHTGLSFRTCMGGELFSQTYNENLIELSVNSAAIKFIGKTAGKLYEEEIPGTYLDNRWHTVHLLYILGNLTLNVDRKSQLISNGSYRVELLRSPGLDNEGAVLIVGKHFNGCIMEGPSIVFNESVIQPHDVKFGTCPIADDSCIIREDVKGSNFCLTEPCMRHGTCINGETTYSCICSPRYSGKNCEVDMGSPCKKSLTICNNGQCIEDNIGNYHCSCPPRFTGLHCETEIETHPLCSPNPCFNGGSCQVVPGSNKVECFCPPGFDGPNCEVNVDDCKKNPCKNNGVCIDGPNNFTCDCLNTGYTGTVCEVNINECLSTPCLYQGVCFDTYGSFICQCMPGYSGQICQYKVYECASQPCMNHGECEDKPGGYICHCAPGYTGQQCEMALHQAKCDLCGPYGICVDESSTNCVCKPEYPGIYPNCNIPVSCFNNPCKNGGTCTSHLDSFNCTCPPGFTGPACDHVELCVTHACDNGATCIEDLNSYKCLCPGGFTGVYCEQHIKCADEPCIHDVECIDFLEGYYCTCEPGWTGFNCDVNVDECLSNPCLNGATCIDQAPFFMCQCVPGFAGDLCQIKSDECASFPCLNGGTCENKIGGYICKCSDQWMGINCERSFDICEKNPCLNNGICKLTASRHDYVCDCVNGFEGRNCEVNINDCLHITCPPGKVCIDLVGGYDCRCPLGYDGVNCTIDIDPCNKNPCPINSQCMLMPGSYNYTCKCQTGYTGLSCSDIDECKIANICNEGICVNNAGSYQCYCKPGYTGERCNLDFDECLSMPCFNNATCLNKVNNFDCVCPPGFTGKTCAVNIDECESNPCMNDSQCIDGINEFACICQTGLTGRLCDININDCLSQPCQNGAKCIDGLNSYTCDCDNTGYTGEHCELNIDDCLSNPCTNGGICHDQIKDYYCKCYNGYTGKNCEIDVDECQKQPCKDGGTCLERSNKTLYHSMDSSLPEAFHKPFDYSTAAGYFCLCVPGITGPNCETNINECESNPCSSRGTCVDKIGYYLCQCEDGFQGVHCELDVDECELIHPCVHGRCVDKIANYFCDCEPGYGGKNCSVELSGCKHDPCQNNGTCIPFVQNETEHRYNCTCQSGFYGPTCEILTTMSLTANSIMEVNTSKEEGYDFQFRFKTTLEDGLLALGKGQTYIILELSEGKLTLNSSLLNKLDGVSVGRNLNNSNWQRVFVAINSSHVVLSANDEQTIYPITLNEYNASATSFPTTYIGGVPSNIRNLAHGPPYLVGCIEDVIVNSKWVLPTVRSPYASFRDVEVGCHREPQCNPNPCHSGGHCTDKWQDFSCTCERPYLGHTCQYNFTAATFGYENITNSLVTVTADKDAKRAVRSIVDISMFIRTRQSKGQIFYLGSVIGSGKDKGETYVAAQLEGGELRVKIQFHENSEAYTVGGVHLDNGYNHLIEVIRNVTLVQVKLNGTEYFRKTISATGTLDAEVLFLGGLPGPRPTRQVLNSSEPDVGAIPFSGYNFKGIIQDVQISNGSKTMVVEFFPLRVSDLKIPIAFGSVYFDTNSVLPGVLSDNLCSPNPCYNGTCMNTWNDYQCKCPRGYKGKDCKEKEFCEIEHCPAESECRNLEDGFECIANATFDGETSPLIYNFTSLTMNTLVVESFELSYRTKSSGVIFYARYLENYFRISVHLDEVMIEWNIVGHSKTNRFKKDHFDGQWITLYLKIKDGTLKGGFKELVNDDTPNFIENNFDIGNFSDMFLKGIIYVGGSGEDGLYAASDYVTTTTNAEDDENAVSSSRKRFKGCLGEIRVDNFLLPYFQKSELSYFVKSELYPKSSNEYFELLPGAMHHVGCRLCDKRDCNRGECIDPVNSYKCNCPIGFTSDDCSVDINECEENECENESQCIDLIGMYRCNCTSGYEGIHCEHEIDECESNPCLNGGTCENLIGMFKCICPEDFVGEQCENVRLITCMNNPCKENSTCRDDEDKKTGNNFTCDCAEGMAGTLCDTPYCILDKCMNNGLCNVNNRPPKCDCAPGYEGNLCTIDIDDCESSPCINGGECIDRINGYDCNCVSGFNGSNCEFDIDECAGPINPCGRGKCNNTFGSYKCTCDNQKCGYNCNMDDPCLQSPCENGAVCEAACTDQPDYKCNCFDGWTGKNCSEAQLLTVEDPDGLNILYVVVPVVVVIVVGLAVAFVVLVNIARSKRATRGTYSPSAQEFCNPRVELDHVLKPPPEERLI